jgi:hypothetical protein
LALEGKKMSLALTKETNAAVIKIERHESQPKILEREIKQSHLSQQFNKLLAEAIDEAITSLGVPLKNQFYLRLELNFNMEKEIIPRRLEEFSSILHKIFGLGACRLEIKFLKNLEAKLADEKKIDYNISVWIEKDMSFIKSINNKRNDFIEKSVNRQLHFPTISSSFKDSTAQSNIAQI